MNTEEFIKDCASRGWSKTQVMETLGLCRRTFVAILEAMPVMEWAPPGKSLAHKLGNEARRGHCSDALRASNARNAEVRRERCRHDVKGLRGTVEELAQHFNISASSVRRRMKDGMTIEEALTTPPTPLALRRKGYYKYPQRVEYCRESAQ